MNTRNNLAVVAVLGVACEMAAMAINVFMLRNWSNTPIGYDLAYKFFPAAVTGGLLGISTYSWIIDRSRLQTLLVMAIAVVHCMLIAYVSYLLTLSIS